VDPVLGSLVYQLPRGITLAYDLYLGCTIDRWKGIVKNIHLGAQSKPSTIIEKLDPEKSSFRPSKWPRKLKTAKNSKLPKLLENCFEAVGKGGWPPISTWITYRVKMKVLENYYVFVVLDSFIIIVHL
jgi:hypothetical protein